jgi:SAM-dependent methyltransferase
MNRNFDYICPIKKTALNHSDIGLTRDDGLQYPYLAKIEGINPIPVFIDDNLASGGDAISQAMYRKADAEFFYENYLSWLFQTFHMEEASFRKDLAAKLNLKKGNRVLITGCGLGDDIEFISAEIGANGEIFAQDISDIMVAASARRLKSSTSIDTRIENIYLSVSNASLLPYTDGYFDGAYHFGGINLFSDMKSAISEMTRVVKTGGKVVIGDEGVAPWLKGTEYGQVAITNNPLWASEAPLALLPENVRNVNLSWTLGNCFYIIDFVVGEARPFIDWDIKHKGTRGGSMRTRYFGRLEGIDPTIKKDVLAAAISEGTSVSDFIERVLKNHLKNNSNP